MRISDWSSDVCSSDLTFPNHWTLVTGEVPDRHGIVANRMEDPARPGEIFTMASDDPFWWNAASPNWVDAEKEGIRTATMFWPGAHVAWGGTRPADWRQVITGGRKRGGEGKGEEAGVNRDGGGKNK